MYLIYRQRKLAISASGAGTLRLLETQFLPRCDPVVGPGREHHEIGSREWGTMAKGALSCVAILADH